MKKILLVLTVFSLMACEKDEVSEAINDDVAFITAEALEDFSCVGQQVDTLPTIEEARTLIVGTWQLKGIITMVPSQEVPNIKIEFKEDGGVFVTNAGENVFTNAYSINDKVENDYRSIVITTDEFGIETSEYNFLTGTIRICQNELMIDNGIAFDAPGYLLRRVEE